MTDADRLVVDAANLTAFGEMLACCEGTAPAGADAYRVLFGYHPVSNPTALFDVSGGWVHPNIKVPFVDTTGRRNYSTAAGKWQFLYATATRLRAKLNILDANWFSPTYQWMMMIELLRECRAFDFAKSGNIAPAMDRCAKVWASLPSSNYPQPRRSVAFALAAFVDAGGTLA